MPTNDERRQVAARLRKAEIDNLGLTYSAHLGEAIGECVRLVSGHECLVEGGLNRLADLIEPVPERTCTFTESNGLDDSPMPTCSSCGYVAKGYETAGNMTDARIWYPYPYCLNCGARVKEEE